MRVLVYLTAIVLLASCSAAKLPIVKGIDDVKVSKLNKDSLYLDVGVRINNPGTWGYRVKKVDIALKMNDQVVGSIKGKLPFKLISKGDRIYNVNAGIGTSALIGMAPNLVGVLKGKDVNLKFEGDIKMRWFIFSKKIHIDSSKGFKLPKLF